MEKKKFCDVKVMGATVCFFKKENRAAFLDAERFVHWLDFGVDKEFSRMTFNEGQLVWIYLARERNKIVSVMYQNGENLEDLPKMEPVEI